MFTAKRRFVRSHQLHLHTWWWKRLQEAREVHSSSFLECPQSCWQLFWHFRWCSQSPQLWSQVLKIELLRCHSCSLSLSLSQKKEKKKKKTEKKNERTSWLVSGRHVTQKCQQSLPLLHQWRVSSSRHKDYESFEEIPAALFKASGSKARWRPAGHH